MSADNSTTFTRVNSPAVQAACELLTKVSRVRLPTRYAHHPPAVCVLTGHVLPSSGCLTKPPVTWASYALMSKVACSCVSVYKPGWSVSSEITLRCLMCVPLSAARSSAYWVYTEQRDDVLLTKAGCHLTRLSSGVP